MLLRITLIQSLIMVIGIVNIPTNATANRTIFIQEFSGTKIGLAAGDTYTSLALNTERNINKSLITSVAGGVLFRNSGDTSAAIIATDNSGISATGPNYFENSITFGARTRITWTLKNAAPGESFNLGQAEIVVSGPISVGFRAGVGVGNGPSDNKIINFNNGNNITTAGTYSVDLSSLNLTWTDSFVPFTENNHLRLLLMDAEGSDDAQADGILKSFKLVTIPEPGTYALVFGMTITAFIFQRKRMCLMKFNNRTC